MPTAATIYSALQSAADHPGLARGLPPRGLLSAHETAVYHALAHAKRRRDWLLGRATAKELLHRGAGSPDYASLSILAAADGAPEAWLERDGEMRRRPGAISISHAQGVAFCAAATAVENLGADIELIAPRVPGFARAYFSAEEQAWLEAAPAAQGALLTTAVWSAKEAALKALRAGLRLDTRTLTCTLTPCVVPPQAWQPLAIRWQPVDGAAPHVLQGWWRVWENFVLALAVNPRGETTVFPAPPARLGSGRAAQTNEFAALAA